jgi:hypothetical protein
MTRRRKIVLAVLAAFVLLPVGAIVKGPPKVPAASIQTSVIRDEALLARAFEEPVARTFTRDIHFQPNPSICGPASLVNTFRSFGERVPDEGAVLAGSGKCWSGYCIMGLTLDELAEVARKKTSREVQILRDLSPEQFRAELRRANDPSRRMIVNFDRKPIFGAGAGHHSPIGAYLEDRDLVLVLDVNGDFKPWLVERERLFRAVDTVDSFSGKKRGLLVVR